MVPLPTVFIIGAGTSAEFGLSTDLVPKDDVQAYIWHNLSAAKGNG
jgi:hypothetical protein